MASGWFGSIVIAGMVRAGYPKDFAAGAVCNAGTLGILILAPILFPIAMHLGIDPVHLGIIMVVNWRSAW